MTQAPCKDCKDRQLGCHDKCNKYLGFKIENEKTKNMIRESKREHNLHIEYLAREKAKRLRAHR